MGFPVYRNQSALSFPKGRSLRFLQFLCLFNHVEVKILFFKCPVYFVVSSGIIRLLDFLIFFGYYREYCLLCGSPLFCKRCVFIHLLRLALALFTFGVLGP